MQTRFLFSRLAHVVTWVSLAASFLVVGAPGIRQARHGRFPRQALAGLAITLALPPPATASRNALQLRPGGRSFGVI